MSKYHLLIDKFIRRTISLEEQQILEKWVLECDANMTIFKNYIKDSRQEISQNFDSDLAYKKFSETLKSKKRETPNVFRTTLKYAAVLVVVLTVGFFTKQQLFDDLSKSSDSVVNNEKKTPDKEEIVIKLANGTSKILNPKDSEALIDEKGNIIARQGENLLVFDEVSEEIDTEVKLNEVYIPYGHTFRLKLSDGTLVWLNAGSKFRFPQRFIKSDKERIVYLEGEAFFDVTEDKEQPFIVNTHELDIKVHGTKFNISSYETDNFIATTLVEGSVSVYETRTPENTVQLKPDFQANYDKFSNNFKKSRVDPRIYTAWMQNKLIIDHMKFSEILVKLERRHHVKFINNADYLNNETYKGEFENEDIEAILRTISLSTPFKYEIDQNIITITK